MTLHPLLYLVLPIVAVGIIWIGFNAGRRILGIVAAIVLVAVVLDLMNGSPFTAWIGHKLLGTA